MATTWKIIRDNDLGHGCSYNLQFVFGTPLAADDKRTMLDGNPMLILKPWLTVKFTLNIISPLYGLIRNSNSFHLILFQDQADISDQKEKQGYDIRKKTNFNIKKKN